jgi:8-oxo-dGTP pyrophosphatase MutT (NUDIX family)
MAQKYKVFINTSRLIAMDSELLEFEPQEGYELLQHSSKEQLIALIDALENSDDSRDICLHSSNFAQLWLDFKSMFSVITAGGGLVENPEGALLFIYRHKKWDLPKGKKEKGECIEESAVREVQEECGLQHVVLGRKLTTTWHTFGSPENRKLKKSVWFHMYSAQKDLIPQVEEGISKIRWVEPEGVAKKLQKAYPSITEVLQAYNRMQAVIAPNID